jgi:hypothetical protein
VNGVSTGTAEQHIVQLEQQLYDTLDAAERHRLFQLLIKEEDAHAKNVEFITVIERSIARTDESIGRQKELVARLKREGLDIKEAYFLLITLKARSALLAYRYAMAKEILVCVVPSKG